MVFFYVIPLAGHKILVEMLKAPSLVGVSKDYDARLYMQASFFSLKASISPQWIIPRVCLPSTLEGVSNRRLEIAAGWCWTILTAAMQQIGCMESWVIFYLPCWFCLGQRMVRLMAYIVWFMTICSCFLCIRISCAIVSLDHTSKRWIEWSKRPLKCNMEPKHGPLSSWGEFIPRINMLRPRDDLV